MILLMAYLHNDIVDGNMNELDEEANESHDGKTDGCGNGDLLELCNLKYTYTVKCHYNACHYNANASLTRSILGSQTAPTCPHDHPRVAQHMGKRCEIITV